jgi:hypothetical protein
MQFLSANYTPINLEGNKENERGVSSCSETQTLPEQTPVPFCDFCIK